MNLSLSLLGQKQQQKETMQLRRGYIKSEKRFLQKNVITNLNSSFQLRKI